MGKLYIIYFSPTGGTKKAAGIIGSAWDCEKEEIDLLNPDRDLSKCRFGGDDVCIVAVPSFGGRVPGTALERLAMLQGGKASAVLVAVYGNRDYEDTLLELKDTLDVAGFFCAAAVAAVAEHSIIHKFGEGRPDDRDKSELAAYAQRIRKHLEGGGSKGEVKVPGSRPYREYNGVPMKPVADKSCIRCGRCAKECPVQAIPQDDPAGVDRERCISCMHCIAVCPVKARHNNKLLLSAAAQKMKKSCGGRKENQLFLP